MSDWSNCKNILCVRLDNMGDLLMSEPAIRAIKETFKCKITVLTSSMAKNIARHISAIDEVIPFDVPWVKNDYDNSGENFINTVNHLRSKRFDAAVIFTVFSQNPLPAAMLTWLSDIPKRLAYCRENPYELLSDWVPDEEPYNFICHQVRRDINLVKSIGAAVNDESIQINIPTQYWFEVQKKLKQTGINPEKPWLIIHPGVSEEKRMFPEGEWVKIGKKIIEKLHHQILITGSAEEVSLTRSIAYAIGAGAHSCAGLFSLEEFIVLINQAPLVICVNTATAHIAAATNTRVIVLYALTNPQHAPWKAIGKILPFSISDHLQSKNEILKYVQQTIFKTNISPPSAEVVVQSAYEILSDINTSNVPELISSLPVSITDKA